MEFELKLGVGSATNTIGLHMLLNGGGGGGGGGGDGGDGP